MTVAVVINDAKQAEVVLPWAAMIARADRSDLLVILLQRSKGKSKWTDVDLESDESAVVQFIAAQADRWKFVFSSPINTGAVSVQNTAGQSDQASAATLERGEETSIAAMAGITVRIKRFQDPRPDYRLSAEVEAMDIRLLIVSDHSISKSDQDETEWQNRLFRRAPCRTMILHDAHVRQNPHPKVLVAVVGQQDDAVALQLGMQITEFYEGQLTAFLSVPEIDPLAQTAGERTLHKIVLDGLGSRAERVTERVLLANHWFEGLRRIALHEFDIVLVGTRSQREIVRLLQIPPDVNDADAPVICAVKAPLAFANRVVRGVQLLAQRYIPQLDREQRISVVQRVQMSSQWDFDFIALICLSTLIAGLGLVRNSPSVVIGAMLVAPLMTPIVGAGLGMAQGNIQLIRTSFRTVLRGFATAFLIGVLLGFAVFAFAEHPASTKEMNDRGLPSFLDLVVALVSGVAAAYAMGRPNLLSALPGVAIAAALVPPLATSGMSVALSNWKLMQGSLLLFLTNIVAIVLGTTITFWLVGLNGERRDRLAPHWPRWLLFGLVLFTILLTAIINIRSGAQL
jgi:uncharacterized hydrophobic protein (TIGR00271 family)